MSLGDPGAADERVVSLEDIRRSEAIIASLAARRAVPGDDRVVELLAALSWDVDGLGGAETGARSAGRRLSPDAGSATTCPSTSKRGVRPGRVFAASLAAAAVVVAVAVVGSSPRPVHGGNVSLAGSQPSTGQSVARAPARRSHNPHAGATRGRRLAQPSQAAPQRERPQAARRASEPGARPRVPDGGQNVSTGGQRAAGARTGPAAPVRAGHPDPGIAGPVTVPPAARQPAASAVRPAPAARQPPASAVRAAPAQGAASGGRAHHGTKRHHRPGRRVAVRSRKKPAVDSLLLPFS